MIYEQGWRRDIVGMQGGVLGPVSGSGAIIGAIA